ncbi:beta strand repeat-containing protein [Methylobacillus sp. Pita2]|uniref:beta strand repeat-containing protein n=1 Tax=Methylobacillus sp. Pita2 TaxID=3383245 RepID=UPI0038B687B6
MAITQPAVTEQRNGPSTKQNHVTNVTRVHADADGIIRLTESHGALKSVDVADVDLVLGFADGSYIIIPNGALDALETDAPKVEFDGDKFNTSLTELFQQVGTVDAADAGNLRIISENIDTRLTELQPDEIDYTSLFMALNNHTSAPTAPAAPLPQAPTLPQAAQVQRGSINGRGNNSGEFMDAIIPPRVDQPSTYRLGNRVESSETLEKLQNIGFPVIDGKLYVSADFKTGASLRSDLPTGARDPNDATHTANAGEAAAQAYREIITGSSSGNDVINTSAQFSGNEWSKNLFISTNGFNTVDSFVIIPTNLPAGVTLSLSTGNPGSIVQDGSGWKISADALVQQADGSYGVSLEITYPLTADGIDVTDQDFTLQAVIHGSTGPLSFQVAKDFYFTYRDATTEAQFAAVDAKGNALFVLPARGLGYDINAGDGNNQVTAGAGNDSIVSGNGNSTLNGGAGNDTIVAGDGDNVINGGTGNDLIIVGTGNNTIDGGENTATGATKDSDTISYVNVSQSVFVDLRAGKTWWDGLNGSNTKDTLSNLENIVGSGGDDHLIGNQNANYILGGNGDDTIEGIANTGAAGDTLDGGSGNNNTLSYLNATDTVTVTLGNGDAKGSGKIGASQIDDLYHFTHIIGSATATNNITGNDANNLIQGGAANDTLNGGAGDDTLYGGDGDDKLIGGTGTNQLHGGSGNNTASYEGITINVTATLNDDGTGTGSAGTVGPNNIYVRDTYSDINNLIGGSGNDRLRGNIHDNLIEGGAGNDTLLGGGGRDTLDGGAGTNTVSYEYSSGVPTTTNDFSLINLSNVNRTVTVGGNSYTIAAQSTNIKDYANSDFNSQDTLRNIQNVIGTSGNDIIIGSSGSNRIEAGAGNDWIDARQGKDTVLAGSGNDTILGSVDASGGTAFNNRFTSIDGGSDTDTLILSGFNGSGYALSTLSSLVKNIDILNIQGDSTAISTTLTVDSSSIKSIVTGNANASGNTILRLEHGSEDNLNFALNTGEYVRLGTASTDPMVTNFSNLSDGVYTIYNSANVAIAQVTWHTV